MKGHMQDGKFHPHTEYKKGVRKSRDQTEKTEGVRIRKKSEPFKVKSTKSTSQQELIELQKADIGRRALDMGISNHKMEEWEHVVNSKVIKVKHEMINGHPVTTVRFANGEEWFEFDNTEHEEEFIVDNDFQKIEDIEEGEFVKVDHPMVSGFILMSSGKILFGEKEDVREKRDDIKEIEWIHKNTLEGQFEPSIEEVKKEFNVSEDEAVRLLEDAKDSTSRGIRKSRDRISNGLIIEKDFVTATGRMNSKLFLKSNKWDNLTEHQRGLTLETLGLENEHSRMQLAKQDFDDLTDFWKKELKKEGFKDQ